jgi:DNA polymerase-3 subunit epsilon
VTFDQTHWAPTRQRGPLPTFYYHEHFMELLDFVSTHYSHALLDEHATFVADFRNLPREVQCLYVRLINRKGRVFARNRIRYPELGSVPPLLDLLQEREWVDVPDAGCFDEILAFLTRHEIYQALLPDFVGISRSLRKPELVEFVHANVEANRFLSAIDTTRFFVQRRTEACSYLLFLFFGRIQESLSRFTMRDLGLVRTQQLHDNYEPRFTERSEALEHYFYAKCLHQCEARQAGQEFAARCDIRKWPPANFPGSAALRDQLALALGKRAEKAGDIAAARDFYEAGESAECSQRYVRLLLADGAENQARQFLERCLDDPRSEEEWLLARDLYERKFRKKKTSALTDVLRAAESIDIDESLSGAPERAVAAYFESRGMRAFRTENQLWSRSPLQRHLLPGTQGRDRRPAATAGRQAGNKAADAAGHHAVLWHAERRFSMAAIAYRSRVCAAGSHGTAAAGRHLAPHVSRLSGCSLRLSGSYGRR